MPSYKVHMLGGCITYVLVAQASSSFLPQTKFSFLTHLLFFSFSLLGSIFPDIDIASRMQRIFFLSMLLLIPLALWWNHRFALILGLLCLLLLMVKHRTITHQIWFLITLPTVITLVLSTYNPKHTTTIFSICIYFIAGALSHRLLDVGIKRFFAKK